MFFRSKALPQLTRLPSLEIHERPGLPSSARNPYKEIVDVAAAVHNSICAKLGVHAEVTGKLSIG